jgi:hypothetical protein
MHAPESEIKHERIPIEIRNPIEIRTMTLLGVDHSSANEWMEKYNPQMSEIINTDDEIYELAMQKNIDAAAEKVRDRLLEKSENQGADRRAH